MPEDVTVGLVTGEQLLHTIGSDNEQWWLLGYTLVALICIIVLLLNNSNEFLWLYVYLEKSDCH